jgi:xanthosine utilization system XapX-like protein
MGTALAYAMCNVQVPVLCLLILLGILFGEHVMHLISQVTFAPGLANQHETDHSNRIVDGSKHTCMLHPRSNLCLCSVGPGVAKADTLKPDTTL